MTIRQLDRLIYSEIVCDFFSEIRGRGLLLSPLELNLVANWEKEGIPADVVCRGLQNARESYEVVHPGKRLPQKLSYYAPAVWDAWRAYREKAVGGRDEGVE